MSLYNMLHGENAHADILLAILGVTRRDVPRYRDCYFNGEEICIYTRTGGGNRDYYESLESCKANYPEYFDKPESSVSPDGPWNEDLRKLPTFKRDSDDEFDVTYVTFYFGVPEPMKEVMSYVTVADATPEQRWETTLAKLKSGDKDDPQVKRALEIMTPILEAIKDKVTK